MYPVFQLVNWRTARIGPGRGLQRGGGYLDQSLSRLRKPVAEPANLFCERDDTNELATYIILPVLSAGIKTSTYTANDPCHHVIAQVP
jgi:hypothetical protein